MMKTPTNKYDEGKNTTDGKHRQGQGHGHGELDRNYGDKI
jgi:hypothetical protein